MYLYYENSVLNKLIVSLVKPFSNLEEEFVISYEKFEDLDLAKIVDSCPNEELVFISASFIDPSFLDTKVPKGSPVQLVFIMRDGEEVETDDYTILNWYIYWTNMLNTLQEEGIERELVDWVYNYFYKLPSISERRVVEYLTSLLPFPQNRFVDVLKNETLSMIMTRGKNYLEQKNREIVRDKNNSTTKIIKDIRCSLCISNYLETAFQILDKSNVDVVLLFEINLKNYSVDVTIIPRDANKIPFPHLVKYRNGFISNFRITFREFVDILQQ
jgi:hypothetical protein